MSIAYGIKIRRFDDPYIINIQEAVQAFSTAATPGAFLVDLIPALKYIPSWFPGAGFKRKAAHWAKVKQKVVELPFNHVAQQMVRTNWSLSVEPPLCLVVTSLKESILCHRKKARQVQV